MSYEPTKCEHIKTNGVRCGSPALRDEKLCYFHHRARHDFPHRAEPVPTAEPAADRGSSGGAPRTALDIPFPEDADAIQYGLGKVIYGLLNGLIDHKSAGLVLYALQTASGNLKNTSLFKRSQKADEEDRSNVSPLLAYYLGPSREDYSRVLRILQEAEADLKNKTREIADLKDRLGMPCEEEASEGEPSEAKRCEEEPGQGKLCEEVPSEGQSREQVATEPAWVERLREVRATEPREERYPRNVEPARMRVEIQAVANDDAGALYFEGFFPSKRYAPLCPTPRSATELVSSRPHLRCDEMRTAPLKPTPGLNGPPSAWQQFVGANRLLFPYPEFTLLPCSPASSIISPCALIPTVPATASRPTASRGLSR